MPDGGERDERALARAARERLLSAHHDTVASVTGVADRVADGPLRESTAVTEPLSAALAREGLDEALLGALADAVAAVGEELPHDPVPEPPYLTVTSRGPVLRATLPEGRLVVVVGVFAVERGEVGADGDGGAGDDASDGDDGEREREPGPRYVRAGDEPGAVLSVEFHGDERAVVGPDGDATDGGPSRE